jgi:Ser/Thr protein kinase RdoA (MazF antagonist)
MRGGYANDLFLADAPDGPVVIRVVRRPVDVAGLEWETGVLAELRRAVPEIAAPIPALDGGFFVLHGPDAVLLLPYVEGTPADPDDPGHRAEAAALLGRLHRAARGLELEQRPGAARLADLRGALADGSYFAAIGPTAQPLPPELERRRDELRSGQEWMLELVERLARERRLEHGLVHGDYFRGNVLVRRGRAAGLIDFEEARLDWTAADLAGAVWEFCKREDYASLDAAEAGEFVAAYRAAGGTSPPADDDLLVPLIRVRRILEVLRAPYDRHVDWDYHLANLDAFSNLG